jgi:CTP:molybdopterin cytidylyltransferase MocA
MALGRAGVILAAGASERMGRPKALLAWGDTTLLEYALRQARAAGLDDLVVVLGPATRHLQLDTPTVFNPDPDAGRSASVRIGSQALPDDVGTILIQSVDQPVSADVIDALFRAVEGGAELVVPTYRGRRGHPACFSGRLLGELRGVSETGEGLRAVVRRHAAQLVEVAVNSQAVLWNLNDPAAYAAAVATLFSPELLP